MAKSNGPDETGKPGPDSAGPKSAEDDEFDRRRRQLDVALAGKRQQEPSESRQAKSGSGAGYAVALRLSSEFIAGILVGAAIGWVIDRLAGTSPWGLIVFFLLGFCAGILNVLRSSGMVAERKALSTVRDEDEPKR